jgi:hypothetical protein
MDFGATSRVGVLRKRVPRDPRQAATAATSNFLPSLPPVFRTNRALVLLFIRETRHVIISRSHPFRHL